MTPLLKWRLVGYLNEPPAQALVVHAADVTGAAAGLDERLGAVGIVADPAVLRRAAQGALLILRTQTHKALA